jgi:phosphatidylserine decarboxylase
VASGRLIAAAIALAAIAFLFWRHVWFFRDPPRSPPAEPGLVSPADGTVVYVKKARHGEPVISVKQGLAVTIEDIAREDLAGEKLVIGVFMSPFDVHYNRAPFDARVASIRRHAARGGNESMTSMHWRTLLGLEPRYAGSTHIVSNERTVTAFEGTYRDAPLRVYVVQIGALTVNGIESHVEPGRSVARGETFGMIRIGSQVDLIVPWREGLQPAVAPGDVVRAGETIVVR